MEVLIFVVAVLVSAIDPLLLIGYAAAGYFAPNWRWAALYGPLSGLAVLILLVLIRGQGWQPRAYNVAAQLVACTMGAVLVRLVIDAVKKPSAGAAGTSR